MNREPGHVFVSRAGGAGARAAAAASAEESLRTRGETVLHAAGSAAAAAIVMALQLARKHGLPPSAIAVNTSTLSSPHEIPPHSDDGDFQYYIRQSSAVHIKLSKINNIQSS